MLQWSGGLQLEHLYFSPFRLFMCLYFGNKGMLNCLLVVSACNVPVDVQNTLTVTLKKT